jgi:hypothetical protein
MESVRMLPDQFSPGVPPCLLAAGLLDKRCNKIMKKPIQFRFTLVLDTHICRLQKLKAIKLRDHSKS